MCSAEETLRRVLEIRSEILEDDDPALATTRTSLASVLQRKGKTQDVSLALHAHHIGRPQRSLSGARALL